MRGWQVVGLVAALAGSARAEAPAPTPSPAPAEGQHLFAVTATVGWYSGLGGGVRIGTGRAGVHLLAGWQPLIVAVKEDPPRLNLDFHSTLQGNADLYLMLFRTTERAEIGLTAGYKYSTHLGHGAGLGAYVEIDGQARRSIFILAGVLWFPRGETRLREKEGYPPGTEFAFPGPSFSYSANVGLSFFP